MGSVHLCLCLSPILESSSPNSPLVDCITHNTYTNSIVTHYLLVLLIFLGAGYSATTQCRVTLWPHGGGFSRKNCFSLWVYTAGGTVVYLAIISVVDMYDEQ